MKINIGCGGAWFVDGWVGLDNSSLAHIWQRVEEPRYLDCDVRYGLPFEDASADVVFSSHNLEHFTYYEGLFLLYEVVRVLKPRSPICLVVPDMDIYIQKYLARDSEFLNDPTIIGGVPKNNLAENFLMNFYSDPRFNNTCHRHAYNFENLASMLDLVGFDFIERRNFHDFSYCEELRANEFKSSMPRVEQFSLCVQARKKADLESVVNAEGFLQSMRYAREGADLRGVESRLAAVLLREDESVDRFRREREEFGRERDVLIRRIKELNEREDDAEVTLRITQQRAERERDALICRIEELNERQAEVGMALRSTRQHADTLIERLSQIEGSVAWRAIVEFRRLFHRMPQGLRLLRWLGRLAIALASMQGRSRLLNRMRGVVVRARRLLIRVIPAYLRPKSSEEKLLSKARECPQNYAQPTSFLFSPRISIILPTFNTPHAFLREAIESVRTQTYENWQLVIVDDGSTNAGCLELIEHYSQLGDERIVAHFMPENAGIARTSQVGIDMADGEFVGFLDHDDILACGALSAFVEHLRANPQVDMLYSDHAMLSHDGRKLLSASLKPGWSPEFILSTSFVVHFKIVRRAMVGRVGGFADTLHLSQDYGLTLKLLGANALIEHVPQILYFWRVHPGSVSSGVVAKPPILESGRRTIETYVRAMNIPARVVCPAEFAAKGISVYKLEFPPPSALDVTIIVPLLHRGGAYVAALERIKESLDGQDVRVFAVGLRTDFGETKEDAVSTVDAWDDLAALVAGLGTPLVVFVSPDVIGLTTDWLAELIGYFGVAPTIGAVGGKIVDADDLVAGGGMLALPGFPYIGEGQPAADGVYWFNGRIASNVEAVSADFFATRSDVYHALGGHNPEAGGRGAGVDYGWSLRKNGYRTVYNPWAHLRIASIESRRDDVALPVPEAMGWVDRYYNPYFDSRCPFKIKVT